MAEKSPESDENLLLSRGEVNPPRTTTKPQSTEKLINFKKERLISHSYSLHSFWGKICI
jgi:hypothetical protein